MCGRSSLTKTEAELEKRFNATFYSEDLERYNPLPNYNMAPTHRSPIITCEDRSHLNIYRWGLIPYWAKDEKIGYKMINARIETIREKNTYAASVQKRRCLIPMDGFYEWSKQGQTKKVYRIQTADRDVFSCAGMYEHWRSPSGEVISTYTIITTPPNDFMAKIHDRMPAILLPEAEEAWLDMSLTVDDALSLLDCYPDDLMKAYEVSPKVGNVRERGPELILPVDDPSG